MAGRHDGVPCRSSVSPILRATAVKPPPRSTSLHTCKRSRRQASPTATERLNASKDSSTRYPMVRRPQPHMGKASRRKNENRELKRTNPEQFAQSHATAGLSGGIDPASSDPAIPVALARELAALFDAAKRTGNIDPPVRLLHTAVNATLRGLPPIAIACKKGCSHCCPAEVGIVNDFDIAVFKLHDHPAFPDGFPTLEIPKPPINRRRSRQSSVSPPVVNNQHVTGVVTPPDATLHGHRMRYRTKSSHQQLPIRYTSAGVHPSGEPSKSASPGQCLCRTQHSAECTRRARRPEFQITRPLARLGPRSTVAHGKPIQPAVIP